MNAEGITGYTSLLCSHGDVVYEHVFAVVLHVGPHALVAVWTNSLIRKVHLTCLKCPKSFADEDRIAAVLVE